VNALSDTGCLVQSTSKPPPVGPQPPDQLFQPSSEMLPSSVSSDTNQPPDGLPPEVMSSAVVKEEPSETVPEVKPEVKAVLVELDGEVKREETAAAGGKFMEEYESSEIKTEVKEIKTEPMETSTDGSNSKSNSKMESYMKLKEAGRRTGTIRVTDTSALFTSAVCVNPSPSAPRDPRGLTICVLRGLLCQYWQHVLYCH